MEGQKGQVLIVEDERNSAKLLYDLLSAHGYEVVCEMTGLAAQQRMGRERFDLVILDLRLPEQNGFVVAEHMRQSPSTKHIPIIVVSAYADRQNRLRAYRAGVNVVLSKPVDTTELMLIIRNILAV